VKPRILVIRGGAIGDFILTLPAIKLLRENFPDAHLEILGYRHIVAVAEGRFYAEGSRSIEYGPMAGFFVPHSVLDPALAGYFASFHQVISYLFDPDGFFEGNLRRAGVKNFLPAYQKIDDSEHASLQLARPLQKLALFLEDHAATVYPSPADRERVAPQFRDLAGPVIAIHPGSGSPRKNWPVEHWIALGQWIFGRDASARVLLVGGEADGPQVAALSEAFAGKLAFIARDLELPKLAAFLERCAVFLGHDSGISHRAAAAGTRCILLFGPTDPAVWAPANPDVTVLQAPEGDLTSLPVDLVAEALEPLLGKK